MNRIGLREVYRFLDSVGGCDAEDEYGKGWDDAVNCMIKQVEEWMEENRMVVKFQKALNGSKVLVYDKNEVVCQELPLTLELNALFGNRYKMYRNCMMDKKGVLHIGREVKGHF